MAIDGCGGVSGRAAAGLRLALARTLRTLGSCLTYRVRARDARIRVMRRTLLIATCKNKTAQQRTIAIIIHYFSKEFYRYRQLTLVIQTTYIELQCGRRGSCKCEEVEEALQA